MAALVAKEAIMQRGRCSDLRCGGSDASLVGKLVNIGGKGSDLCGPPITFAMLLGVTDTTRLEFGVFDQG